MFVIQDGTGTGKRVGVNDDNRLRAESIAISRQAFIAQKRSDAYLFCTNGFVSITTTGTEHGIFYIKYTGEYEFHIDSIRTCGTVGNRWLLYKNPTTGTLISGATNGNVINTNLQSNNEFEGLAYKGGDGSTITDGTVMENWINNTGHSTELFDGTIILGKNDSVAVSTVLDSAGLVCIRILGFLDFGNTL